MQEKVMRIRWESATRYYEVVLQQDLFGDWVLSTSRGGLCNRLGALRHLALPSKDAAVGQLVTLHKRRIRRGYQLVAMWAVPDTAVSLMKSAAGN